MVLIDIQGWATLSSQQKGITRKRGKGRNSPSLTSLSLLPRFLGHKTCDHELGNSEGKDVGRGVRRGEGDAYARGEGVRVNVRSAATPQQGSLWMARTSSLHSLGYIEAYSLPAFILHVPSCDLTSALK